MTCNMRLVIEDVVLVLLWLFQDLILWLFHTQQIASFLPRRN